MKVLVVGANGKVAKHFAELVKDHKEIDERAVIRNAEQKPFFELRGIDTVELDIVHNSIEAFAEAMKDTDAVIFSAGAGGKGLDKTVMIDLDGAVKVMTAAEQAGVKRFVMVSTFRTGREEITREIEEDFDLKVYTIAKHYADDWLKNRTQLDWTIIHPGILSNNAGTGNIKVGMGNEINEVPREDVAQAVLAALETETTIHKEFEVLSGNEPVNDAVKSV